MNVQPDLFDGKPLLTAERLRETLHYNPKTGVFRWRIKRGPKNPGDIAGCIAPTGYAFIGLFRARYLAHRLAWLYITGQWPAGDIDHRNRITHDNKWENLRDASTVQNCQNNSLSKANTSGVTGVCWHKRGSKWMAYIRINGKHIYLGLSTCYGHAIKARRSAELHHFGAFSRRQSHAPLALAVSPG